MNGDDVSCDCVTCEPGDGVVCEPGDGVVCESCDCVIGESGDSVIGESLLMPSQTKSSSFRLLIAGASSSSITIALCGITQLVEEFTQPWMVKLLVMLRILSITVNSILTHWFIIFSTLATASFTFSPTP